MLISYFYTLCLTSVYDSTAPKRCNGHQELVRIPVELYALIFDNIQASEMTTAEYKTTFSTLSLVCRMFSLECQPRFFRSVQYSDSSVSMNIQHGRSMQHWNKLLKEKDPRSMLLAGFVREFTLSFWGTRKDPTRWYSTLSMNRHLSNAISFNHLDKVTLKMCFLTLETFNALARMSSVRTMTFDTCSVVALEASFGTTCPPLARWTRLSVSHTPFPPFWSNVLAQFVNIENVEYISVDCWNLACTILDGRIITGLRELRVRVSAKESLTVPHILKTTPGLVHLSVRSPRWLLSEPIDPTITPRLNHLEACSAFAAQIVPGRPIVSLQLLHEAPSRIPPFDFGKRSSTSIRSLSIPSTYLRRLSCDDFPHLEILTIVPRCVVRSKTYAVSFPVSALKY